MLEVELVGPDGSVIIANSDGTTMTSSGVNFTNILQHATFMYLQFVFFFWFREICSKAANEMLMNRLQVSILSTF